MKGFTGRRSGGDGFASRLLGGREAVFVGRGWEVKNMKAAGRSRRRLNSHGEEEYTVVAKRVAPQFMRKSTRMATGL